MTNPHGGPRPGSGRPRSKEKMIRKWMFYLPDQFAWLLAESAKTGKSIPSIVRAAIDEYIKEGAKMTRDEIIEIIDNGCKMTFLPQYADPNEVFTISQFDGNKGWAGDPRNRGWHFTVDQVSEVWHEDE